MKFLQLLKILEVVIPILHDTLKFLKTQENAETKTTKEGTITGQITSAQENS